MSEHIGLFQMDANEYSTTSNLAVIPGSWVAFYSATKATLASYILSLRENLRNKNVKVIELSPPAVQSRSSVSLVYADISLENIQLTSPAELHDYMGKETGRNVGIPLKQFTDEAIEGFTSGKDHIIVGAFPPTERFFDIVEKRRAAFEDLSKMMRSH